MDVMVLHKKTYNLLHSSVHYLGPKRGEIDVSRSGFAGKIHKRSRMRIQ